LSIPIPTLHLFPVLQKNLIELLRSLDAKEWQTQTIARLWKVKDVAAHILDGNLRRIAAMRDGWQSPPDRLITSNDDLISYLNDLNASWVKVFKRVSPQQLIEMIEASWDPYMQALESRDPYSDATWSVSWAGQAHSLHWLDTAREYTEKWLHQQQIRDAVKKPGILTNELYHPFLEIFMLALPHTYRGVEAPAGTCLQFTITGQGGGNWWLVKNGNWELHPEAGGKLLSHTTIDGEVAWKLFSASWKKDDVENKIQIEGDKKLGSGILDMVSVMA